ncbi:RsmB/NOP family class I SAM-dependent RNA methyltransferase [Yoonia sp.]|uniref:RsmB/NOP family class I SAM-dependent RNA methyltransferase n=1 Tax=Yoonia sp. TaxID=2212373 RepID=UPI0025E0B047|nr:RsmB/NOP family class I SAM-dependent RNA methyltransferase [Yoonia sp.]
MTPGARVAAAIGVLDDILHGAPAERALTGWARGSRFAGSKDRAAVRDHVFDVLRAKRSLAARGGAMTGRALMLALAMRDGLDIAALFHGEGHAPQPMSDAERDHLATSPAMTLAEAHDIPEWLWPLWLDSLGDNAQTAAAAQQTRADVYLRVNRTRGTVTDAIATLAADDITAVAHPSVPFCLRVTGNTRRIKNAGAYVDGLVELQDAASQFAVSAVPVPPGGRILDYCAGGGGKALAFADQHGAQVFAHDIAPRRMKDLPVRAARAQVHVAQLQTAVLPQAPLFDVVFCDAPCSGSGTWRRTPDAKWRLTVDDLAALHDTQDQVISAAARLVGASGMLVYATCSVLEHENDAVVARFRAAHSGWRVVATHHLLPGPDWDGFFMCCMACDEINL